MYRIPQELDLSKMVGQVTTQIRVGQFDLHFSFGDVNFAIQSPVELVRNGEVVGNWREGEWPSPEFFEVMNVEVTEYKVPNNRTIVISLAGGLEIYLSDNSDQFECMQISFEGESGAWVI
ncbi:hypothetical protein [Agarivorans albus]|uniref:hypothetical protein n=1 Tax=Agarivorans albus TaxID=182262 RepID=UPI00058F0670|nr:hypothetical protein [Agarivorans albus]